MKKSNLFKFLSYSFSIVSTFPVVAPVLLTIIVLIRKGKFLYDFMMPAELILFTIIASLGIITLQIIDKKAFFEYKKLVILFSLSISNFLAANIYAYLTGLAHGDTNLNGIHLFFITIFVILWHLFAILISIECFKLTKKISTRWFCFDHSK